MFELQQAVDAYDFYRKQITQCDSQLKQYMVALPTREALPTTPTATEPVAATDTGKKCRPRATAILRQHKKANNNTGGVA